VATKFALYLAKIGANEEEPATPAQVRAYARAMHMSCSAPRFGQYPCSSDVRERNNTDQVVTVKQLCVAILTASGQISAGHCADPGVKVAPVITPGYVNCATIGKVVDVPDPAGDQVAGPSAHPIPKSARGNADLRDVRIAATARNFCVDFQTTRPCGQDWRLNVGVEGKSVSALGFEPSISAFRTSIPGLYISEPSATAGQVGFDGDWTSLLIPARDSQRPLPTGPFTVTGGAEYEVDLPGGGYSIGDSTQPTRYP
jgi:hypothetical protein